MKVKKTISFESRPQFIQLLQFSKIYESRYGSNQEKEYSFQHSFCITKGAWNWILRIWRLCSFSRTAKPSSEYKPGRDGGASE